MIVSSWVCDYCGEEILGPYYAVVRVRGLGVDLDTGEDVDLGTGECDSHYHAGDSDSCYRRVMEGMWLAQDAGPTLENIPTISAQAVTARRRKHTKPVDEED